MTEVHQISASSPTSELWRVLRGSQAPPVILIVGDRHTLESDGATALVSAASRAGVASASPIPAGNRRSASYPTHHLCPPPPTLGGPCPEMCALNPEALLSLGADITTAPQDQSISDALPELANRLLKSGWRHVGAPGLALDWDPTPSGQLVHGRGSRSAVSDASGSANVGLEAHQSWARSQTHGVHLLIDGACLDSDLHTGTQHLVIEVTRQLKRTRPTAQVSLAVPDGSVDEVRQLLGDESIEVVERHGAHDVDVVYRPYQMLRPTEIEFIVQNGRRLVTSQLDMIGYSNPYYHPSSELFFLARNLQRFLMRASDCVTFISEYGRQAAVDECPDLAPDRLHVVSCGADPRPSDGSKHLEPDDGYILCLSATFWHKNRCHAISTFAHMAEANGYDGSLIIAGPEPFYGRSVEAEDDLLMTLPEAVRQRVHRLGQVDDSTKWSLLRSADAVVYPSVVEGFGLIPFEAAAVGTPCLLFAGTAPGEILGGTQAAIATWDHHSWAERLMLWVHNRDAANHAVGQVLDVAERHTWKRCAERTWSAIDASLALPRQNRQPEEGGLLPSVRRPDGLTTGTTARFLAVRALPAIRRRTARLAGRRKSSQ